MNKFIFIPLDGEKWKGVSGFNGYYVSNYGRVWSEKQKKRFMSPTIIGSGYLRVKLRKDGRYFQKLIHRLVAEEFIPNPNGYQEVNHKDENKENNYVDNLEWCTRKYNNLYGKAGRERYEKMKITQRNSRNDMKAVECLDLKTNIVLFSFKSIGEAVRVLFGKNGNNWRRSHISQCCLGKRNSTCGYRWRYKKN